MFQNSWPQSFQLAIPQETPEWGRNCGARASVGAGQSTIRLQACMGAGSARIAHREYQTSPPTLEGHGTTGAQETEKAHSHWRNRAYEGEFSKSRLDLRFREG